jgi:hypothetical protein
MKRKFSLFKKGLHKHAAPLIDYDLKRLLCL